MRFSGNIKGIWLNTVHGLKDYQTFEVEYTADEQGKSLSIRNLATGDKFRIPFDDLYKIITKSKR